MRCSAERRSRPCGTRECRCSNRWRSPPPRTARSSSALESAPRCRRRSPGRTTGSRPTPPGPGPMGARPSSSPRPGTGSRASGSPSGLGAGRGPPRTPSRSPTPRPGPWPSSWSPRPSSTSPTSAAYGSTWTGPRRSGRRSRTSRRWPPPTGPTSAASWSLPWPGPGSTSSSASRARSSAGTCSSPAPAARSSRRSTTRAFALSPLVRATRRRCSARRVSRASWRARAAWPRPPLAPLHDLMVRLAAGCAGSALLDAVDLNPVRVSAEGVRILDARVLLTS